MSALPDVHSTLSDPFDDADARAGLDAWRADYVQRLASPTGWWAVTNLAWMEGKSAVLGASPAADLPLRAPGPARVARLEVDGDALRVVPSGEAPLRLDDHELTHPVSVGRSGARLCLVQESAVEVAILHRAGRWGVRVYDASQAAARNPAEVGWFDVQPGWRVRAVAQPAEGETLPIVDLLGNVREVPIEARLRFHLGGSDRTLLATAADDGLFVNFRDATNGSTTYGAGRFLTAAAPRDGTTVLDFHRAYHPPCAHTPHAMCPLPALANRLDLEVRAGERHPRPPGRR